MCLSSFFFNTSILGKLSLKETHTQLVRKRIGVKVKKMVSRIHIYCTSDCLLRNGFNLTDLVELIKIIVSGNHHYL